MTNRQRPDKVRITLELSTTYLRALHAKAQLSRWYSWLPGNPESRQEPPRLDAGAVLAWLVLLDARGAREGLIHAATPLEWRTDGPQIVSEARECYAADGSRIPTEVSHD